MGQPPNNEMRMMRRVEFYIGILIIFAGMMGSYYRLAGKVTLETAYRQIVQEDIAEQKEQDKIVTQNIINIYGKMGDFGEKMGEINGKLDAVLTNLPTTNNQWGG